MKQSNQQTAIAFFQDMITSNDTLMELEIKQIAKDFLEMIIAGNIAEAYHKYTIKGIVHHNPYFPGDMFSLQKGMEENHKYFPNKVFEIQQIIADESRVMVHAHLRLDTNNRGMATIHILRFEDKKIVEMWDIAQPIPKDMVNKNGMF